MRFSVAVDGDLIFDRAFNRIDSLSDLRPLWPEAITEFYLIEQEQFDSEGAAGGQRWAPLSASYAEDKEQVYPGQPILQAEGTLMASLTDPEAPDAIVQPLQDELILGTRTPYALAHQRGSRRGLPRRPPISFSEQQKRRLQKALQRGLVQFISDAGFNVEQRAA